MAFSGNQDEPGGYVENSPESERWVSRFLSGAESTFKHAHIYTHEGVKGDYEGKEEV